MLGMHHCFVGATRSLVCRKFCDGGIDDADPTCEPTTESATREPASGVAGESADGSRAQLPPLRPKDVEIAARKQAQKGQSFVSSCYLLRFGRHAESSQDDGHDCR